MDTFIKAYDTYCSGLAVCTFLVMVRRRSFGAPIRAEKHFDKPTVITDTSVIPRQSHYACPYCMSRLDIVTEKSMIVDIRAAEYPKVLDSPAKCAHFNGLLNAPAGSMMQDECLVCPKVLQCNIRKR